MNTGNEILLNASHVTHNNDGAIYEFIIDMNLCVKECISIDSLNNKAVSYVNNPQSTLQDMLFELNHVRVNPTFNNKEIVRVLTDKLKDAGVSVSPPPESNSMSMCFAPLGQINSNVRFNFDGNGSIIFMSPHRPKLFCTNK